MATSGDWVHVRSPFVYWAQTESTVSLRIDISNAENPQINIGESKIVFDARSCENEYHFDLGLAHDVNPKKSSFRVVDREILINLSKKDQGWWSKVTTTQKKPAWLKVDFDRWKSPDDEDEVVPQDILKDYPDLMNNLRTEEFGYKVESLRKVYLFMYNLFQLVGYLYIVGVLTIRYMKEGQDSTYRSYEFVGFTICYCQILQMLEIVHAIFGFTKSNIPMAILQILGRNLILFGIINPEVRLHQNSFVFYLFVIWAIADIIRYPFYMLQIYKIKSRFLTWIRYSGWILLYPLGILSECVIIFNAITYFEETEKFSVLLPNRLNATFYFPSLMRLYLIFGVFPASTFVLKSMWRSRAKVLKESVKIRKE